MASVWSPWPPSLTSLAAEQLREQVSEEAVGNQVELRAHMCADEGNSQQIIHTPVLNCQLPLTQFSADAQAR